MYNLYYIKIAMNRKTYKQLRMLVAFFVGIITSIAIAKDSYLLAAAGVFTGMLFMFFVRARVKINTDERELAVQEKAARMTYLIFTQTLGITAFLLLLPSKGGWSIFQQGEWLFLESLGLLFAYLTLFLIALYAFAYHFFNHKYGGTQQ